MMKALSNLDLSQRSSFNLVRRSCWTAWSVSLYTRESQWLYNIMVQRKGATSGARSRIPDTRFHKQKWHANNLVGFSDVIIVFICHKLSHSKCLVKLMMRVSWRKPCMQLVQWRKKYKKNHANYVDCKGFYNIVRYLKDFKEAFHDLYHVGVDQFCPHITTEVDWKNLFSQAGFLSESRWARTGICMYERLVVGNNIIKRIHWSIPIVS